MKKKTLSSIAASGSPNAIANDCARMPRGSEFGRVACNNIEDSRRDLLLSRRSIKADGKNAIFFPPPPAPRNYPARTVIVRIVKRTPSFLCSRIIIRLSRRLQLPFTHIPRTNFIADPSRFFEVRASTLRNLRATQVKQRRTSSNLLRYRIPIHTCIVSYVS